MSFFKQIFPFMKVKKKKEFSYIIKGVDPNTIWDIVGELGDGSFGKVYKVMSKFPEYGTKLHISCTLILSSYILLFQLFVHLIITSYINAFILRSFYIFLVFICT